MQLAHAVSDSALVLSTLSAIRMLVTNAPPGQARRSLQAAAVGLGATAIAAFTGVLRFAGIDALAPLHEHLSGLASCTTMPILGAVAIALAWPLVLSRRRWFSIFALHIALFALTTAIDFRTAYGLLIGATGTMSVLLVGLHSLRSRRRGGAMLTLGAGLVLIAGLAIGTRGELGPFARLDLFHYLLAMSNLCLGSGLLALARAVDRADRRS